MEPAARNVEQESWCNEFATLYRFETKLDMSVCMSVAINALRTRGTAPPATVVARLLSGAVTRARPSVETLQGNLNLRRPR